MQRIVITPSATIWLSVQSNSETEGRKAVQKHHYKIHDYDAPDKDVVPYYAEFVVVAIEVIPLLFTEQPKCYVDGCDE